MKEIKCPKCGEVFQVDESGYAAILKQVRDSEFTKEIQFRESQFEEQKTSAVQLAILEAEKVFSQTLIQKDAEISKLKSEVQAEKVSKKIAVNDAQVQKDKEISQLKNTIDSFNKDKELEISKLVSELKSQLIEKDSDVEKLKSKQVLIEQESLIKEQSLKEKYEERLRYKDEEIAKYKDFKAKLSTKMIGESLEIHCENEFNKLRAMGFQNAYFEKDNNAKSGSKGDFIYRDFDDDGCEFISIMFEMKNEADMTATKKKNEDFFKELDKDRNEKACEYAVLVSMLEPDNEYYNSGIVDVSYKFPKMYVVRPQFFMPLISLLKNASKNSLAYKKELLLVKNQNIDVSNFEASLNDFKDKLFKNYENASKKFKSAIDEIDKSIYYLQKTKEDLLTCEKHLLTANNKAEDLTIKRLTKNNPTMSEKFAMLNNQNK